MTSSLKDSAQKELKNVPLHIGDIFVHYKEHGLYEVVALALKEDTLEPLVIYRAIDHGKSVWARVWDDWNAEVEWKGKRVKRFKPVAGP